MKAIQVLEHGGPEVLQLREVERPQPRPHQVLIRVKAAGVNYADVARRKDRYLVPTPVPFIPGSEVAGEIVEVGSEVRNFKVGDRVVCLTSNGYAEYTIANESSLVHIPDGLDDVRAAAIPLQGLTAYHIIKTSGRLQPGESILVHAAAGGVGTLSVQLARQFGAGQIIATASTQEKLDLARSLGATHTVNYTEDNWDDQVLEITDGKGVDVILEMVGGDEFMNKNLRSLAVWGRMVVFGAASGVRSTLNPGRLMAKNQEIIGFHLSRITERPDLFVPSMTELMNWIVEGKIRLVIGGSFPLAEAAHVHRILEGRQTTGKLVLVP